MDGIPPVITAPDGTPNPPTGTTITADAPCNSQGTTVVFDEPSATDNSGTVILDSRTHSPGDFFPIGNTDVTYVFVDSAGNSASYTFTVNVREGNSFIKGFSDVILYLLYTP